MTKSLQPNDIARAAAALGVPEAAVRAVCKVESNGAGFLADGRPKILFERHVMYRQLKAEAGPGDAVHYSLLYPSIVNKEPGGYATGPNAAARAAGEWDRLDRAIQIHRPSALESASWGMFQIMGFHWKTLGLQSPQQLVNLAYQSEGAQLELFVKFVQANPGMWRALKAQDWAAFARAYNGPNYRINQYDTKLANAFKGK